MSQSKDYFKNFVNNHKFTFVASIASILGLVLGLVIFFPAQKRPFYSVRSFNLINDSSSTIENLDIKYKVCNDNRQKEDCKLEAIKSLTVTQILFWNGGRTKIDKTDVDDNPITIVASDDNKILEAKVVHISNDKTNFSLEQKTNIIHFNFLDSGNGGVIQIVHTGLSNENITLDGYVEESRFNGKIERIIISKTSYGLLIVLFLGILFFFPWFLFKLYKDFSKDLSTNKKLLKLCIATCFQLITILIPTSFLFFHESTLRYPLESYELFNSEITTK